MALHFPGLGTVVNVVAILLGAGAGVLVGRYLSERTRAVITDCLGLVTLVMAAGITAAINDAALVRAVGSSAPLLIVLGSLLLGSMLGSWARIEDRVEALGGSLQARFGGTGAPDEAPSSSRQRFIEGFLSTSLLFCIGPVAVLGSISDGLGRGIDQLVVKSALDGMASVAFASSLGIGVAFSALSVGVVQGVLTLVGVLLGALVPDHAIAGLSATGGVMLIGIALRLLDIRDIRVGDMLPALVVAPVLTWVVAALSG